MTQKQIKEEYTRIYRKYSKSVKFYAYKYGIIMKLPRKIKHPTQKSIERLETAMREQLLHARSRAAFIRSHSVPRDKAAINALYDAITQGLTDAGNDPWAEEKAKEVRKLLDENIPVGYTEQAKQRREGIARHIERNLRNLHEKIAEFVRASKEGFEHRGTQTGYCWAIISRAIPEFIYIDYDTNEADNYFYYNQESGEIYE